MEFTGISRNSPVNKPGAYFWVAMVAIRWGNRVLIIMAPKKP